MSGDAKFVLAGLAARPDGRSIHVSFSARNVGKQRGKDVVRIYVSPVDWKKAGWEAPKRLGGFAKADLKPGQTKPVELTVDPRLLATYEAAGNNWHIRAGDYRVMLGEAADAAMQSVTVSLPDALWSASSDGD